MVLAGPAVCDSVASPAAGGATDSSAVLMITVPATVELARVATWALLAFSLTGPHCHWP